MKQSINGKNSLIRLKLIDYIPVLVISNISTLLILIVDGIVVGNYVGVAISSL